MWRKINLKQAQDEVVELEDMGMDVMRCTDFHWKINGIDCWPSTKKFLIDGKVVRYNKLNEILSHIKTRQVVIKDS